MRLLGLEVESVVGTGVDIEAVVPARGLRPFHHQSRVLPRQRVQWEEEGVANCCCLLVDQHTKLLIHLGSSSPLDETVCRFPCNFTSCCSCTLARGLLSTSRLGGGI